MPDIKIPILFVSVPKSSSYKEYLPASVTFKRPASVISRMAKGECDSIKHISQARLFRVKSCQVQLFIYPLNKPICFHPLQSTQIISDYNSILFTVSLTPREARRRKRARPHTRPLPDDLPIPHYHFVPLFHTCRCYQPGILIGPFGPFGILFSFRKSVQCWRPSLDERDRLSVTVFTRIPGFKSPANRGLSHIHCPLIFCHIAFVAAF